MIEFDFQVSGIKQVSKELNSIAGETQERLLRTVSQTAFDEAQTGADSHTVTGRLARSLQIESGKDQYKISHDLQHAPHAPFVHWGTAPHLIRPKNKKALRWVSGNGFIFAKAVRHPGYKGDPWLIQALDYAKDNFERLAQQVIKQ